MAVLYHVDKGCPQYLWVSDKEHEPMDEDAWEVINFTWTRVVGFLLCPYISSLPIIHLQSNRNRKLRIWEGHWQLSMSKDERSRPRAEAEMIRHPIHLNRDFRNCLKIGNLGVGKQGRFRQLEHPIERTICLYCLIGVNWVIPWTQDEIDEAPPLRWLLEWLKILSTWNDGFIMASDVEFEPTKQFKTQVLTKERIIYQNFSTSSTIVPCISKVRVGWEASGVLEWVH